MKQKPKNSSPKKGSNSKFAAIRIRMKLRLKGNKMTIEAHRTELNRVATSLGNSGRDKFKISDLWMREFGPPTGVQE